MGGGRARTRTGTPEDQEADFKSIAPTLRVAGVAGRACGRDTAASGHARLLDTGCDAVALQCLLPPSLSVRMIHLSTF
jgi:hypothetical protein